MRLVRWQYLLTLATLLGLLPVAGAQQASPHIGYIYPAGGRQGTTFHVTVGGQLLTSATEVFVSGGGIQIKVLGSARPLTQKEFTILRDQLQQLQAKRKSGQWTYADTLQVNAIMKKLANPPNKMANPAIAESVSLEVTLAAGADPSQRELRVRTPLGLSNPLPFFVGQLPEFTSPEQKNTPGSSPANPANSKAKGKGKAAAKAIQNLIALKTGTTGKNGKNSKNFKKGKGARAAQAEPPALATMVDADDDTPRVTSLPSVINGQIMPGEVDRYRLRARKGQHLVIAAAARELIPYLADAVPGWFQATLTIYDAQGHELAYDDDFRFSPDPVIYYEVPSDGDYILEIKDSIYRGREDFVYRITVGELPFVTGIYPLGGPVGSVSHVTLKGWNLPVTSLSPQPTQPGLYQLFTSQSDRIFNRVLFDVGTLPEVLEQENNDTAQTAQAVAEPVTINGRINKPGDVDVFKFEGRAGERVFAEVKARRLNSPLDSTLKVSDAAGKMIACNDDYKDKGFGLLTHQADSLLSTTLPASGTYYVQIADTQNKGGEEYAYRLRISPPQPDFELRLAPSSINTRVGATVPITVTALRKDGFAGEIALTLKNAPMGYVLSGSRVPAGQDVARLTLTVPSMPQSGPATIALEGRAVLGGKPVVRQVVPAEDMMQAFFYQHLVPSKELKVTVLGRARNRSVMRMADTGVVRIPAGGSARFRIGTYTTKGNLELSDPPAGITIENVVPVRGGVEVVLHSDASKVKAGQQGNLIINAFSSPSSGSQKKKATTSRKFPMGVLPAIPFEITG